MPSFETGVDRGTLKSVQHWKVWYARTKLNFLVVGLLENMLFDEEQLLCITLQSGFLLHAGCNEGHGPLGA